MASGNHIDLCSSDSDFDEDDWDLDEYKKILDRDQDALHLQEYGSSSNPATSSNSRVLPPWATDGTSFTGKDKSFLMYVTVCCVKGIRIINYTAIC